MTSRKYYQTHVCNGYRAKITVEWNTPDGIELLPERAAIAEEIAAVAAAKVASTPYEIVQAMMGR